jgi:hypothetical protein
MTSLLITGPGSAVAASGEELHRALYSFNRRRLRPAQPHGRWREALLDDMSMQLREGEWVEEERRAVARRAAQAPTDPDGFVAWFEALKSDGPGQGDALFPWLAREAPVEAMRWFLQQEVAGEAGFDDLVALSQIKLPRRPKLEMARNYWDEMGRGHEGGMHGPLLDRLAEEMSLTSEVDGIVWESLALANVLVSFALNRRYTYQSIGALGAIELTAPGRAVLVNEGLDRLGVSPQARRYFALHATLDVKHSEAWNEEILRPLVASDPGLARPLAEGALLRLRAGARCFERYRRELGVSAPPDAVHPGNLQGLPGPAGTTDQP